MSDISIQYHLFCQFWKLDNGKPSIGTIACATYDIKYFLCREGWELLFGLAGQWEDGGIFIGESQTLTHT